MRVFSQSMFCVALAVFPCLTRAQPMFQIIDGPPLEGTLSSVAARGVSGDGSVVVGCVVYSQPQKRVAFTWTLTGGSQRLGDLTGGNAGSCALAASMDGSVIVGEGTPYPDTSEAVRWLNGVIEGLGDLQGGLPSSAAIAVSLDGSVIVGAGFGQEAFRWHNGVMVGLGNLDGGLSSAAWGVSATGNVVVGSGGNRDGRTEAFRWENNHMIGLGYLPSGNGSQAFGISPDGEVIVGLAAVGGHVEAFRWQDSVMRGLGILPGLASSQAFGVSRNGVVVVGTSSSVAFIWDQANGMRSLRSVLVDNLGLNLGAWTLVSAAAVSADGLTVVGTARQGAGINRAFVARLGYADTSDTDGDGVPDVVDVCRNTIPDVSVDVAGCPASVPGDLDHDGDVDLMDYAILQRCMSGADEPADPACNGAP